MQLFTVNRESHAARRNVPLCCHTGVLAVCLMLIPSVQTAADETPAAPLSPPPKVAEHEELLHGTEPQDFNVYAGSRIVSQYVSRGLVFSDEVSLQPWIEVDMPLWRDDAGLVLQTLSWFVGAWNNVNLEGSDDGVARTGRARELKNWYEADLYTGLRGRLGDRLINSIRYNFYTSPSDSFSDIHELDWRISWNDPRLFHGIDLHFYPALRVAVEVHDQGGPDGVYIQPSLTPTWRVRGTRVPVTLQVPLVLGFGAEKQYVDADGDEHHFGFFQTGLSVAVDLDLLQPDEGSLTLTTGIDFVILADSDLGQDGDNTETVAHLGLAYNF